MINFIMKLHGFVYSRGHSIMILELTHAKKTVMLLNDREYCAEGKLFGVSRRAVVFSSDITENFYL